MPVYRVNFWQKSSGDLDTDRGRPAEVYVDAPSGIDACVIAREECVAKAVADRCYTTAEELTGEDLDSALSLVEARHPHSVTKS